MPYSSMRWLAAIFLIILVAPPHTWLWSLFYILSLLLATLILQNNIKKTWHHWLKTWRILRWILLPIILLHCLFTPGEIIWLNTIFPISYEGLNLGLLLSLRLSEMVAAALLLSYLLPMRVWLKLIALHPLMKYYLYPYMCLMPLMTRGIRVLVHRTYRSWHAETSRFSLLPLYMKDLLRNVSSYSHRRAKYVWDTWNTGKFSTPEKESVIEKRRITYTFYILSIYIAAHIFLHYFWS